MTTRTYTLFPYTTLLRSRLQFGNKPGGHLVIEIDPAFLLPLRYLLARAALGISWHGSSSTPPRKSPMASPQRRGWAADRDQEARLRAPAHPPADRNWSTPSGTDGVARAATGVAGSAARTRRSGTATSHAAANSGDRPIGRANV